MDTLALVAAAIALILSVVALAKSRAALKDSHQSRRDAFHGDEESARELRGDNMVSRQLLLKLVKGEKLTEEMVREGLLWTDVDSSQGQRMIADRDPVLLDVRTKQETAENHIPGAIFIPMDEIEERVREIPRGDRPLLVYCEGGIRSAAVCDYLGKNGFESLYNLSCGIARWEGEVVKSS